MSINKTILLGRLTKDITVKHGNITVATSSIAVNNRRNGDTMFIDVVFFSKLAEITSKYLKKGSKICITGRLNLNQYKNSSGTVTQNHQIYVDELEMLDGPNRTETTSTYNTPETPETMFNNYENSEEFKNSPFEEFTEGNVYDEDSIPF